MIAARLSWLLSSPEPVSDPAELAQRTSVGSATRAIVGTVSIGATAADAAAERRPRELAELVATAAIGSGGIAGAALECGVTAETTDATAAAELADVQVGEGLELADLGLSTEVISQRANVRALRSFVS